MSSSDALLRTDSLSGTDPALSDGSVGSAPSLGLSPGPPCSADSTRSQDKSKQKSQMMSEGVDDEGLEDRVRDASSPPEPRYLAGSMFASFKTLLARYEPLTRGRSGCSRGRAEN